MTYKKWNVNTASVCFVSKIRLQKKHIILICLISFVDLKSEQMSDLIYDNFECIYQIFIVWKIRDIEQNFDWVIKGRKVVTYVFTAIWFYRNM